MPTAARLIAKTQLSADIADFRFAPVQGRFSGMEPGAHIDVVLPGGLIRQYSLWDWDPQGGWLAVAVKREPAGRGGSRAMHALQPGDAVGIGGPRNHFVLRQSRQHVTLIGGGIGATPIVAMARHLGLQGADFRVVYLTRSRADAALDGAFAALDLGGAYHLHCDDTDGRYDLAALMRSMPVDGDLYCCGPEPMLDAVLDAGRQLRGGTIHFERFAAAAAIDTAPKREFEIRIASTGQRLPVSADETILDVLRGAGHPVEFGCSEGLCGACMVDVIEGEIDHRDGVLSPEEQQANACMCICVSRAKSPVLTLDL